MRSGWFWKSVASELPENLHLTLSDLSPGMVQEAVDRCQSLSFGWVVGKQADATHLPFEDDSFDAVIAMHMLYHLPDPSKGLAEMHRVLKPGGFLAVTTNGAGNRRELYRLTTVFGSEPFDPAGAAFGYAEYAGRVWQREHGGAPGHSASDRAERRISGPHLLPAR